MKSKGTWFLVGFVVLLGLYTYFVEFKKKEADEKAKDQQAKIFQLEKEQVTNIELQTETDKIILEKSPEGWSMTSPIQDAASNETVETFLNDLIAEKSDRVAVEGDNIDWKEYGLENPKGKVTLKDNTGATTTVAVSGQKDFNGNFFLRRNQENQVLVGGYAWLSRTSKVSTEFRETKIFRHLGSTIESVKIKNANGPVELVNKDAKWLVSGHPDWTIDQDKVREMTTGLGNLKSIEFLGEPVASKFKQYGLDKPEVSIEVKLSGKEETWSVNIAKTKDSIYYGVVSNPNLIVKLDGFESDKFFKYQASGFRDGKLAFKVGEGDIKTIKVQDESIDVELMQEGGSWKMVKGPPGNLASQEKVIGLLSKVREAKVGYFLDKKEQGLYKNPKSRVTLLGEGEKELFALNWTQPMKLKIGGSDKMVVLMSTSQSSEPFAMEEATVSSWNIKNLVAKAPEPATDPKNRPSENGGHSSDKPDTP